ncbi:MAG TPA: hypothetical protein VFC65_20165 [Prolixibacteraceae bacterium]|nr:hypothetical protein [Prolixibacteraceae bacterium]
MKTKKQILILFLVSVFLMFQTSCAVIYPGYHSKSSHHYSSKSKIPPGQKKKMTGAKSAKKYAPGHNKKHKK